MIHLQIVKVLRLTIFNLSNKKSGTDKPVPDVIEEIRNEKQELLVFEL